MKTVLTWLVIMLITYIAFVFYTREILITKWANETISAFGMFFWVISVVFVIISVMSYADKKNPNKL